MKLLDEVASLYEAATQKRRMSGGKKFQEDASESRVTRRKFRDALNAHVLAVYEKETSKQEAHGESFCCATHKKLAADRAVDLSAADDNARDSQDGVGAIRPMAMEILNGDSDFSSKAESPSLLRRRGSRGDSEEPHSDSEGGPIEAEEPITEPEIEVESSAVRTDMPVMPGLDSRVDVTRNGGDGLAKVKDGSVVCTDLQYLISQYERKLCARPGCLSSATEEQSEGQAHHCPVYSKLRSQRMAVLQRHPTNENGIHMQTQTCEQKGSDGLTNFNFSPSNFYDHLKIGYNVHLQKTLEDGEESVLLPRYRPLAHHFITLLMHTPVSKLIVCPLLVQNMPNAA